LNAQDASVDTERVYQNDGNPALIALLDASPMRVLDVGCGAGDNVRLLKLRYPGCELHGVTQSPAEANIAGQWLTACWVFDIESGFPQPLTEMRFDTMILSHVLEHLRDPALVLQRLSALLMPGGCMVIAVPNALSWVMRLRFMRGNFDYQVEGVLDETHLRFFTYLTADRYLLRKATTLKLMTKTVTGSVPQWWLRRHLLPTSWSSSIDRLGCHLWPNLFGEQVLLKAVRESR
jgi:2-polyprenyl-3-methyl-5-hydroxy-6-metoxy-1,4-benzoquinol methylase